MAVVARGLAFGEFGSARICDRRVLIVVVIVIVIGVGFDPVPDRQLHPGGDNARRDLQVNGVIVDTGDGGQQARGGVHPVADRQRVVQVDGGLHRALLAPR